MFMSCEGGGRPGACGRDCTVFAQVGFGDSVGILGDSAYALMTLMRTYNDRIIAASRELPPARLFCSLVTGVVACQAGWGGQRSHTRSLPPGASLSPDVHMHARGHCVAVVCTVPCHTGGC